MFGSPPFGSALFAILHMHMRAGVLYQRSGEEVVVTNVEIFQRDFKP